MTPEEVATELKLYRLGILCRHIGDGTVCEHGDTESMTCEFCHKYDLLVENRAKREEFMKPIIARIDEEAKRPPLMRPPAPAASTTPATRSAAADAANSPELDVAGGWGAEHQKKAAAAAEAAAAASTTEISKPSGPVTLDTPKPEEPQRFIWKCGDCDYMNNEKAKICDSCGQTTAPLPPTIIGKQVELVSSPSAAASSTNANFRTICCENCGRKATDIVSTRPDLCPKTGGF
jgi:hypothetical protein